MYPSSPRILIVEDDEDMLSLLHTVLTQAGYIVETAKAGSGIVDFRYTVPDLFLLDNGLPTIDGIAVSKFLRIQEETKGIPIVMISGFALAEKSETGGSGRFYPKAF